MALCGILNIHLMLAIALNDRSFIRLMVLAAFAEIAVFAVLHGSAREIIAATAVTPALALVAHEIRSPNAVWRLIRARRVSILS
jgi:hypothetical protein